MEGGELVDDVAPVDILEHCDHNLTSVTLQVSADPKRQFDRVLPPAFDIASPFQNPSAGPGRLDAPVV